LNWSSGFASLQTEQVFVVGGDDSGIEARRSLVPVRRGRRSRGRLARAVQALDLDADEVADEAADFGFDVPGDEGFELRPKRRKRLGGVSSDVECDHSATTGARALPS
jgi:hypothetical protein